MLESGARCAAAMSTAVCVQYRWSSLVAVTEQCSLTPAFPVPAVILHHVIISVCRQGPKATSHSLNFR